MRSLQNVRMGLLPPEEPDRDDEGDDQPGGQHAKPPEVVQGHSVDDVSQHGVDWGEGEGPGYRLEPAGYRCDRHEKPAERQRQTYTRVRALFLAFRAWAGGFVMPTPVASAVAMYWFRLIPSVSAL